mmetsp:Transcript_65238/g.155836  ORF Transcript_65238/g.155836 Transcript_65238/m.155836 type:complete len:315 (-) Transcript_65238:403-1347(-)
MMPTSKIGSRKLQRTKGQESSQGESQDSSKLMIDNFFEALAADPARCCYGLPETLAALELYGIDELFVAREPAPPQPRARAGKPRMGSQFATEWEALAAERRARIHWIDTATVAGKRFCKGFLVGGVLRWRIDPDEMEQMIESMMAPIASTSQENTLLGEPPKRQQHQQVAEEGSNECLLLPELLPQRRFFQWLGVSLRTELDDAAAAQALEVGVQVILADVASGSSDLPEALEASSAMLVSEGAYESGSQLAARWYTNGGVVIDELPPLPHEVQLHSQAALELPRSSSCHEECLQSEGAAHTGIAEWSTLHVC